MSIYLEFSKSLKTTYSAKKIARMRRCSISTFKSIVGRKNALKQRSVRRLAASHPAYRHQFCVSDKVDTDIADKLSLYRQRLHFACSRHIQDKSC